MPARADSETGPRQTDRAARRREAEEGENGHRRSGTVAAGSDLAGLLTKLKSACGAGGTLKDEELEIQGNNLDRVRAELTKSGYRVKG